MFIFCSHSIWFSDLSVRLRLPFWQVVLETERTRAIRLTENLIALYFYNNSNNVAILLPTRTITRQKPLVYALFGGLGITPTLYRRAILPGFECFSLLKPSFLPSIIHQLFGLSDFVVARRVETKRRATGRDSSQCLTRTAEYEFQGMISTGKNKEASSFWPLVSYHFMYKLSTI